MSRMCVPGAVAVATALALLASVSPNAQAVSGIEAGHPDLYENGQLVGGRGTPTALYSWGEEQVQSEALGSAGIECGALLAGAVWNEGSPLRSLGEVLSWDASGHIPTRLNNKLSANCVPETAGKPGSFITDEVPASSERNEQGEVEPALRALSTPWNLEARCGARSEEEVAIIKIGVPSAEFPNAASPCPSNLETGQAEEEAAYTKEREEKRGCYSTIPAPPGCMRLTVVEPAAGAEFAFGGTLRVHNENGVKNALLTTAWNDEGAAMGELRCEVPIGCTALATIVGSSSIETPVGGSIALLQWK